MRTRPYGLAQGWLAAPAALTLALLSLAAAFPTVARTPSQAAGCAILPADDIWNTPVDTLPVDPASDAYIETIGVDGELRADFGSGEWEGGPIGIPWVDVPAGQDRVSVSFLYQDESDPGPYPIPADAPIEGGPESDGDRHVMVIERGTCTLYELFNAFPQGDGNWQAGSGAVFELGSSVLRPDGWTSADAAGLPILPGLVRLDEVAAGEIDHAPRFTVPDTRREYVWPARHFASDETDRRYPPMGQRFRLRADVDLSGFSADVQVILRALQTYGMLLADNGSPWFLSGAPDERWDNDMLRGLRQVRGSDFEAVDVSSLMVDPDTGQARVASAPVPSAPPETSVPPAASTSPVASTSPEPLDIAADLFVASSNTTGIEDGSAESPYSTLQAAIDAAADGGTIAVAAGEYPGNVRIEGRTVHLYGGFSTDFTTRDPVGELTALRGDGTDSVVTLINAGTSTVDGFLIAGGTHSTLPEYGYLGGGVYITGGSPAIAHDVIEGNDARPPAPWDSDPLGGGIYTEDSDVSILDNVIRGNTAGRGGGVAIIGGTPVVRGNLVQDNVGVSDHGGGLYVAARDARITHNRIVGNAIGQELGYGWGGGIIVFGQGSSATLAFNDIAGNDAPSVGSGVFIDDGAVVTLDHELIHDNVCPHGGTTGGVGIYVDGYDTIGSRVTITNTTVAGHGCETQGGNGLYVEVHSRVTITNSIFWGNGGDDFLVDPTSKVRARYTTSEERLPGKGNLTSDPRFADAEEQDYHLRSVAGRWDPTAADGAGAWVVDQALSPAIDAGDPASPFADEPEPNGGRVDMGAYGNTGEASKSRP